MTKKDYQKMQEEKRQVKNLKRKVDLLTYLFLESYKLIEETSTTYILLDLLLNEKIEITKESIKERLYYYNACEDYKITDEED